MKLFLLMIYLVSFSFSKGYALVVTIGSYEKIQSLTMAKSDHIIYREILSRLGVKSPILLHDKKATRKAILSHLHSIVKNIKKGDKFYLFFSGHGSSLYDVYYTTLFQNAGLKEWLRDSGAIFPYDFDPKRISDTIIIGKRDLYPLLSRIDKKISEGLVVVDACYSEQSIRGKLKLNNMAFASGILTQSQGYPYHYLLYIASSITESKSGVFAPILNTCIQNTLDAQKIAECIDKLTSRKAQIPVVIIHTKNKKY